MNISAMIERIKLNCGLYTLSTPFEDLDKAILSYLQNVTRRTFSTYSPHIDRKIKFDSRSFEELERDANRITFLLPDVFTKREIMQIISIEYDDSNIMSLGYLGGGVPVMMGNMISQSLIANANMNLTNTMVPKMTFEFIPPRKIILYNNLISSKLMMDIGFMHDLHFASISPTQEEVFYELALLDIKDMLYQSMKHYAGVQTAYGNIDLKLDDWANAAEARRQLIEKWAERYHIDIVPFRWG